VKIEVIQETNGERPELVLHVEYSKSEWEKLLTLYESNPGIYRRGVTRDLFGTGMHAEVYFLRDSSQSLAEEIEDNIVHRVYQKEKVRIRVIDDINHPVIYIYDSNLVLNIALFRVIPNYDEREKKYVFQITLPERFVYIPGIKFFKYVLWEYVKLLKICHGNKKVKIIYKVEVREE